MEGTPNVNQQTIFCVQRHSQLMRVSLVASFLGLSLLGATAVHAEWKGTIGEPLRDSSSEALKLVEHLRSIGATFYGSWTCPACFRQMNLFGKQAGAEVPYVECTKPKQMPDQAAACQAAKIRAYPTWVLPNGERKVGIQSLKALSDWSGLR